MDKIDYKVSAISRTLTRFGSYSLHALSGTMAAGMSANGEIFQFRWTSTTRVCLVDSIVLQGLSGSATAFTAGFANVQILMARAFTAAGTGGGTSTITTNNCKLRTDYATTTLGEARTATTAALGAGTKTLDSTPISGIGFSIGTTTDQIYMGQVPLFSAMADGDYTPIILEANEGFVMRATVPATGTWQFGVQVVWHEADELQG